jgi:hypothetical protein
MEISPQGVFFLFSVFNLKGGEVREVSLKEQAAITLDLLVCSPFF